MTTSLLAVMVDCRDPLAEANYWATALGHQVSERNAGEYGVSDSSSGGTPLYSMNVPEPMSVKNRLHIDLTTDGTLEDEGPGRAQLGPPTLSVPLLKCQDAPGKGGWRQIRSV